MYSQRVAFKSLKNTIQSRLEEHLSINEVDGPLFVTTDSKINDHLDGTTRVVSFTGKNGVDYEVVQSTAKWKRLALEGCEPYSGLYVDMKAIRCDEDLDDTHTYFVDQWDWEVRINKEDRTLDTLFKYANKVHDALDSTVQLVFLSWEDLKEQYPTKSHKEIEDIVCKEYKHVFIYGIQDGGRAYDYDDWKLNGDLIVLHNDKALELSSMGIRVDSRTLKEQAIARSMMDIPNTEYHLGVLDESIPFSIGGGIGQSRVLMYMLGKDNIREVQC